MLQTLRYGIQVSRDSRHKQTNRQTNQQTTIPAGRGTASGNDCDHNVLLTLHVLFILYNSITRAY